MVINILAGILIHAYFVNCKIHKIYIFVKILHYGTFDFQK